MRKSFLKYLPLLFSILAICTMIFDVGFIQSNRVLQITNKFYFVFLLGIIITIPLKYYIDIRSHKKLRIWIIDLVLWITYILLLVNTPFNELAVLSNGLPIHPKIWLFIAFSVSFLRELSAHKFNWRYKHTNPAVLFVSSFLLIILGGSLMLMLPRATYSGIGFSDALFTSASAVCVTGLVVVETGTFFTNFGQLIILILIQVGGIGIMTFTSFFSYFFMGGSSFQNLISPYVCKV